MISDVSDKRKTVKTFDKAGISVWNENLINSFREDVMNIYKKFAAEKYTPLGYKLYSCIKQTFNRFISI